MTPLLIGAVGLGVLLVLGGVIWIVQQTSISVGAATEKAAQATAEAKAEQAALVVATKGESDAQTVDSLNSGAF